MTINDIDTSGDGGGSSIEGNNNSVELEKIKKECASMINQLMELHEEERQLREANTNLSQRALVMGCTAGSTRGKPVRIYAYADANLGHNKLNGKSVTGVLHIVNGTVYDWHCKLQSVVNTATYGSEATAGRTAIEQIRSNKLLLQHLGVRVIGPSILFGDNKTVVNGASLPQAKLHKRHLMLSYHYLREALATGEYVYSFINGKDNPSDILTKHWAHKDVWPMIRALLFYIDGGTRREAKRKAAAKKAASQTSTPTSQINESTTEMSSNIKPTK